MKTTQLAQIISFIFTPLLWVILFLVLAYYKGLFQYNYAIISAFAGAILFPTVVFFILYATKKISDFDITERKQRYGILAVVNISAFLLLYFLSTQHLAELFELTKIVVVITAVSTLITFWYKISFHMTFSFTFVILINAVLGYHWWFLYLTIPAVFWSRWYLKKHTLSQIALAIVVDGIIISLLWKS